MQHTNAQTIVYTGRLKAKPPIFGARESETDKLKAIFLLHIIIVLNDSMDMHRHGRTGKHLLFAIFCGTRAVNATARARTSLHTRCKHTLCLLLYCWITRARHNKNRIGRMRSV